MRSGSLSSAFGLPSATAGAGFLEAPYQAGASGAGPATNAVGDVTYPDGLRIQTLPDGKKRLITADGQSFDIDAAKYGGHANTGPNGMPASWLQSATDRVPQFMADAANRQTEMAWLARNNGALWQQLSDAERKKYLDANKVAWDAGVNALFTEGKPAGSGGLTGDMRSILQNEQTRQREDIRQKYAATPTGAIDYTHLADGSPSGLDAQGQPPYTNEGALNPYYNGPAVPGALGTPDVAHAPEWSAMYQAQAAQPDMFLLSDGSELANPAYQKSYGWHLGDTPPAQTVPLAPEEAAQLGGAIQKLDGYIANLEGALGKTKDPKKAKELQSKLDTYRKRRDEYAGQVANGTPNPEWTRAPVGDTAAQVPLLDANGALRLNPDGTVMMGGGGTFNTGYDPATAAWNPGQPGYVPTGGANSTMSIEPGWGTSNAPADVTAQPAAPAESKVPTDAVAKAQQYLEKSVEARAKAKTDAERKRLDEQILMWSRRISEYLAR
jgi:hypothetical protein